LRGPGKPADHEQRRTDTRDKQPDLDPSGPRDRWGQRAIVVRTSALVIGVVGILAVAQVRRWLGRRRCRAVRRSVRHPMRRSMRRSMRSSVRRLVGDPVGACLVVTTIVRRFGLMCRIRHRGSQVGETLSRRQARGVIGLCAYALNASRAQCGRGIDSNGPLP